MQLPFDKHFRRRIYLVRHGEARATAGSLGLYGEAISLTPRGRAEAEAMRDHLAPVSFDEAYCSDIPRAKETASIVLDGADITPDASPRFRELKGDVGLAFANDNPIEQKQAAFAYELWNAASLDSRFFGGDPYKDYIEKTAETVSRLVAETNGSDILIVSHSGFQRAALCWALDATPLGIAKFEQDTCCLNILDIDVAADGEIVRKHVRLANYTPLDPVKHEARLTDGEKLARRFADHLQNNTDG